MIDLAVYNKDGKEVEKIQVEESTFGGKVRYPLLKQAIVRHHANQRVGTAANRGRGQVTGSGHKLFRQKGTGNARVGNSRTNKRVGGGVAFAKVARDFGKRMPKKQRRLARNSAVLAKLLSDNLVVVDELKFDSPKTRDFAGCLGNLNINRSCLVTLGDYDVNVYKSARNIPKVAVMPIKELNAAEICLHQKVLFTKEAFLSLLGEETN